MLRLGLGPVALRRGNIKKKKIPGKTKECSKGNAQKSELNFKMSSTYEVGVVGVGLILEARSKRTYSFRIKQKSLWLLLPHYPSPQKIKTENSRAWERAARFNGSRGSRPRERFPNITHSWSKTLGKDGGKKKERWEDRTSGDFQSTVLRKVSFQGPS